MSSVTSADGTSIAYDRIGAGPALILVGGATVHRALDPTGGPLAALLADAFTVITYDRRGRGESGDTAPYAVAREIEDLDALIEAGGGSAFVHDESSGSVLALESARQGSAIVGMACYEPPFMVEAAGVPAEMAAGIRRDPAWPVLEAITHTIAYDGKVMGDTQDGDPAVLTATPRSRSRHS